MELNKLLKVLKEVLNNFFEKDNFLLENNTHEQAISHKIACYLEEELKEFLKEENYSIDVEYNRYGEDPKRSKELDNNLIKPDIIIHRRGKNNNGDNLLVFEVKKGDLDKKDKNKLEAMTKENSRFKYSFGIGLEEFNISENSCKISIYIDGELKPNYIFKDGEINNA